MLVSASRQIVRNTCLLSSGHVSAGATTRRQIATSNVVKTVRSADHKGRQIVSAAAVLVTVATLAYAQQQHENRSALAARIPSSGDVINAGMPTKEKATGIAFPALCNGFTLAGTGVRVKYVFVKVYAVGTYLDPIAMMAVKTGSDSEIEKALLNPTYPRTIRIVMNRGLAIDKYTAAIIESLEPRMKGQELDKLEEFKQLNPPVDLVEGAEIEMTIRGDTLMYKNAVGGVGSIRSRVFTEALCDVYYGTDPASQPHKDSVIEGVKVL